MFTKSIIKSNYHSDYYHVNICSSDLNKICRDDTDYRYLLSLFEKYLLMYNKVIEMLVYTIESDFFDILINQIKANGIVKLMHNIVIDYNSYYFGKYNVDDLLSESNYQISKIDDDNLLDISRIIYLKDNDWLNYPFSSIRAYLYDDTPVWLNKRPISDIYGSAVEYLDYLQKN